VRRVIAAFLAGAVVASFAFVSGGLGVRAAQARRYINLPSRAIAAPFSDAVQVGDTLYLAGRIGFLPGTRQLPATAEEEARLLLDQYKVVLAEAGMTMDDLVSVQVFCSDVKLFDTWNQVYPKYFGKDLPARAFLGSGTLLAGAHFEMQAIAIRR
jgi:2-iminobutanoate/2-iminopropanoate deaminase